MSKNVEAALMITQEMLIERFESAFKMGALIGPYTPKNEIDKEAKNAALLQIDQLLRGRNKNEDKTC